MLETAPLYHQLADQIHSLISAGTLRAGDRVPSVRRLSNQQRVSVSTVLQAYQRLEDIGVIEARPQSGYYVRRPAATMPEPEPSKPPRRALNVEVNALTDAVLAHAADPGVVAFGSACAAPELFPLERVRRVLSPVARPRTGISLEALELALTEHPVKAVLVMPNVSNPIGATMSDAAKKRLVELLASKNVPLIEDHIYAELQFDSPAPRAAKAFDRTGNVMLCSSFSKTLSPGLKVGWIEPGKWGERVRMLKWVASGGQNELVELAVAELIDSGGYERSLRQLRRRFEAQIDTARGVIAGSFPRGTRVTRPSGAYILWVELPKGCDSVALFEKLLERGITIAPGPMFSASQRYRNCMRLSIGQAWSEREERALREIGRLAGECAP